MSNVYVDKTKIDILANAIAAKSGESVTMTLDEMVSAVDSIPEGGGGTPTLETVTKTYTPSTSAVTDTITPSAGYDGIEEVDVTVSAIPISSAVDDGCSIEFVTSGGLRKARFTPWIEYNDDGYVAVTQGVNNFSTNIYNAVASGTTVTPTQSSQTIGGTRYMMEGAVTVAAMPSGSATPAASISATGASVSTGTNTLTLSKSSVSNTPQVSAGYISAGTAGNSSVSLTASVTTQGATTYHPSSSNQTINGSRYLTGNQTINAVTTTNLTADNIKSGVVVQVGDSSDSDCVTSVTGTYTGGGGSGLTLLKSTSLGTLSTTSTSATDTGKSMTVTGYNDYDVLVVDVSVDTATNNRHTSTVSFVILTGTSNVTTKNTYTVGSNKWNSKLSSSGTASTRQSTSAYGIYANAATVSGTTMTITFYYRYNSNNTGTINNSYTARVYGLKLIDLIGG